MSSWRICPENELTMVIEIVSIRTSPEKREEMRRALTSLSGPTETEPGCLSSELFQDLSDANMFRIEFRWKTQTHLIRHIRSDAYKKLLLLVELGAEAPKVEFYMVSELEGLDLVEAARE